MKAAVVKKGGTLEFTDYELPELQPDEVLVKVSYCGICGSDIHMLEAGIVREGCIIGHELSGIVEKVGNDVTGPEKGDRVVVLPAFPCMTCESCMAGHMHVCRDLIKRSYGLGTNNGAFCEYMAVKATSIVKIPEWIDMKKAALTEPLAVAIHGVNMLNMNIGEDVLVIGAGPVGLFTIYALKEAGAGTIIVSETDGYRAQKAAEVGADYVINPNEREPGFAGPELTGRMPDHVMDCAGTPATLQISIGAVKPRGTVLVLGVCMKPATILPIVASTREICIKFSYGYNYREFCDALKLLGKNVIDTDIMISDVAPLRDIQGAFDSLKQSGHTKVLIDCREI